MGTVSGIESAPEQYQVNPGGGMGGGMGLTGMGRMPPSYEDDDEPMDTNPARSMELYEAEEPEMPGRSVPKRRLAPRQEEEDDWGNDELDDILPPM